MNTIKLKIFGTVFLSFILLSSGCSNTADSTFSKNLNCKAVATKFIDQKRAEMLNTTNKFISISIEDGESIYSDKLDTCLYTYTINEIWQNDSITYQRRFLIDSVKNKTIIDYTTNSKMSSGEITDAQKPFYTIYKQYFQ